MKTYANAYVTGETEQIAKPALGLFTLSHFLDRFVYRSAKQTNTARGTSIMQPLFSGSRVNDSVLVKASDIMHDQGPVNTEDWLTKKVEDIKPEDKFFYQYFTTKKTADGKGKKSNKASNFDSDDEMDENEIWSALVKSRPDVEDDSDDSELDFAEDDFSDSTSDDEPKLDAIDDEDAKSEGSQESDQEEKASMRIFFTVSMENKTIVIKNVPSLKVVKRTRAAKKKKKKKKIKRYPQKEQRRSRERICSKVYRYLHLPTIMLNI